MRAAGAESGDRHGRLRDILRQIRSEGAGMNFATDSALPESNRRQANIGSPP
jgi:hypothetical protein